MTQPVTIYTTDYCPYCSRAKNLLKQKGIAFQEVNVTENQALRDELEKKTGCMTVPLIFIGDEFIGGSDELHALESSGELDQKLRQGGSRTAPTAKFMQQNHSDSKWYYGLVPVFLALFFMGPFGFLLLWKSPQFHLFWKVFLTFLVLSVTVWMIQASAGILHLLSAQIKQMQEAGLI